MPGQRNRSGVFQTVGERDWCSTMSRIPSLEMAVAVRPDADPIRPFVLGVETLRGLCTIELLQGDITQVTCDLLAISAFRNSYVPTKGTVMGALFENHGFSFLKAPPSRELIDIEFDLRAPLGIWITHEQAGLPCRRILCVELVGRLGAGNRSGRPLDEALQNVFVGLAILESKGIAVRQLALPLLGTGSQRIDPRDVIGPLVEKTRDAIARSSTLERVMFVERSEEKAHLLLGEIERQFGTINPSLPKADLIAGLMKELQALAQTLSASTSGLQKRMAGEMLELAKAPMSNASSIGVLARRLAELVTDSLYKSSSRLDLHKKIEDLGKAGVSPWVVSYLHTLRVIGNEVVHIREPGSRLPAALSEDDVTVCLFCIQRVAQFWLDTRNEKEESGRAMRH